MNFAAHTSTVHTTVVLLQKSVHTNLPHGSVSLEREGTLQAQSGSEPCHVAAVHAPISVCPNCDLEFGPGP
jgi:hypothetical protein